MKKIVLAGLILCGVAETLMAQSFFAMRRERSLIFTAGTGTSSYLGELTNDGDYIQAKPNLNFGLQYYLNRRIAIRSEITWFQLSGTDTKAPIESGRQNRNLSFSSNNFEINATGIFNLTPQGRRFYQRPGLNLYAFGGIGFCYFNPTTEYQGKTYALAPLQTELVSYSRVTPVIPLGLGVRFKVGPFMNLSIEGGFRKTFTDYLDDVSTVHKDPSKFTNPIAAVLSDRRAEKGLPLKKDGDIRGNPTTDDAYMLLNVKLEYYLPVNFLQADKSRRNFKNKRKAFYRYNKRGGLRK